jgi:hypothetical protein
VPKKLPGQHIGGRLPDGSPNKSDNPKRNAGHALSPEVLDAIDALPQVLKKEWSESYLAEQLWRCYLGKPSDYSWDDLMLIAQGHIVE